jgi:hypothetical protein
MSLLTSTTESKGSLEISLLGHWTCEASRPVRRPGCKCSRASDIAPLGHVAATPTSTLDPAGKGSRYRAVCTIEKQQSQLPWRLALPPQEVVTVCGCMTLKTVGTMSSYTVISLSFFSARLGRAFEYDLERVVGATCGDQCLGPCHQRFLHIVQRPVGINDLPCNATPEARG